MLAIEVTFPDRNFENNSGEIVRTKETIARVGALVDVETTVVDGTFDVVVVAANVVVVVGQVRAPAETHTHFVFKGGPGIGQITQFVSPAF